MRKSLLTSTSLELSKQAGAGSQTAYGSRVQDMGFTQWKDAPAESLPGFTESETTDLKPGELRLKSQQSNATNTIVSTRETRVAAEASFFSGTVVMNGVLLVAPQGGLDMGPYTNGPKPPSVEMAGSGEE